VAAAEQRAGRQRQHPVTDLVADDPVGRAADLLCQPRVPPDVVGVHHHADGVRREAQGQVHRLTQRGDHRPVGAEHRVQRLDAQPNPEPLRLWDQVTDRVCHHPPGQA
jgi:hypothetical protein